MTIQPTEGGLDYFPVAHTCFNLLDLPKYPGMPSPAPCAHAPTPDPRPPFRRPGFGAQVAGGARAQHRFQSRLRRTPSSSRLPMPCPVFTRPTSAVGAKCVQLFMCAFS